MKNVPGMHGGRETINSKPTGSIMFLSYFRQSVGASRQGGAG